MITSSPWAALSRSRQIFSEGFCVLRVIVPLDSGSVGIVIQPLDDANGRFRRSCVGETSLRTDNPIEQNRQLFTSRNSVGQSYARDTPSQATNYKVCSDGWDIRCRNTSQNRSWSVCRSSHRHPSTNVSQSSSCPPPNRDRTRRVAAGVTFSKSRSLFGV